MGKRLLSLIRGKISGKGKPEPARQAEDSSSSRVDTSGWNYDDDRNYGDLFPDDLQVPINPEQGSLFPQDSDRDLYDGLDCWDSDDLLFGIDKKKK